MKKFIKWLDNYWYHYKWHTIIGALAAVFVIVCGVQFFGKEKVDIYILYAGENAFSASQIEDIQDSFASLGIDYNNDGKKVVNFNDITVMTNEQMQKEQEEAKQNGIDYKVNTEYMQQMQENYSLQVTAGDAYICLLSPEMYEYDKNAGIFMTLEELGVETSDSYDDKAILLKSTDFGSYISAFECIPDDTLLVFRTKGIMGNAKGKAEREKYENQLDLYMKIINFKVQ